MHFLTLIFPSKHPEIKCGLLNTIFVRNEFQTIMWFHTVGIVVNDTGNDAGNLGIDSRGSQIRLSVANRSPPLQLFLRVV